MWKPLLGFGAFLAAILLAIGGPPVWEEIALTWAADLEALLWGSVYSEWIASPSLFLILLGFGVGFYLLPLFLRWGRKPQEIKEMHNRVREMAKAKNEFYKHLGRAYEKWRKTRVNFEERTPKTINLLLQKLEYPDWLPVGRKENLYDVAMGIARTSPPFMFSFSLDLYKEVEEQKKQGNPTNLLSEQECLEFDNARQTLIYFWNDVGRAVYKDRKFWYGDIKEQLKEEERTIKALTFLSVSLHIQIHQVGDGDKYFFKLCRRYFYPRLPIWKRLDHKIPRTLRNWGVKSGAR